MKGELVVVGIIEQSQRKSGRFDDLDLAIMAIKWPRQPGVSHLQGPVGVIPQGKDDRHELSLNPAFSEGEVDGRKHFRWARLDGCVRT